MITAKVLIPILTERIIVIMIILKSMAIMRKITVALSVIMIIKVTVTMKMITAKWCCNDDDKYDNDNVKVFNTIIKVADNDNDVINISNNDGNKNNNNITSKKDDRKDNSGYKNKNISDDNGDSNNDNEKCNMTMNE